MVNTSNTKGDPSGPGRPRSINFGCVQIGDCPSGGCRRGCGHQQIGEDVGAQVAQLNSPLPFLTSTVTDFSGGHIWDRFGLEKKMVVKQ